MPEWVIQDLGLESYEVTYARQRALVEGKRGNPSLADYLLLVEHPAVYTSGRKSREPAEVPRVAIERGGEDTFHNPGQVVAYPILRLEPEERDLHRYLRNLEEAAIDLLEEFGIRGERRAGATGVWVNEGSRKIASIGVAVSGWVTYHGLALNVKNDLAGFARIHPCGFSASIMTSLAEILGERCPGLGAVKYSLARHLGSRLGRATRDGEVPGVAQDRSGRINMRYG